MGYTLPLDSAIIQDSDAIGGCIFFQFITLEFTRKSLLQDLVRRSCVRSGRGSGQVLFVLFSPPTARPAPDSHPHLFPPHEATSPSRPGESRRPAHLCRTSTRTSTSTSSQVVLVRVRRSCTFMILLRNEKFGDWAGLGPRVLFRITLITIHLYCTTTVPVTYGLRYSIVPTNIN